MKNLKILITVILLIVFTFKGIPLLYDFGKYLLQKKFDQSQIISIAKSHNYNGIILERMPSYGIGEIYILKIDGTEKSIQKTPLKYWSKEAFGFTRHNLSVFKSFTEDKNNLFLSPDKNYIINTGDFLSAYPYPNYNFPTFISTTNYVNDKKNSVWESMITTDEYGNLYPYYYFINSLSPNGKYLYIEELQGINQIQNTNIDTDITTMKNQIVDGHSGLKSSRIVDREAIRSLFTKKIADFNVIASKSAYTSLAPNITIDNVTGHDYHFIMWTEDSNFGLLRIPEDKFDNSNNISTYNPQNMQFHKITKNFPDDKKVITAISPTEYITDNYEGISRFLGHDRKPKIEGTYLTTIDENGDANSTIILPNTIKFIGFVH